MPFIVYNRIAKIIAASGLAAAALLGTLGTAAAAPTPTASALQAGTVQIKPTIDQSKALAVKTFTFQGQPATVVELADAKTGPVPAEQQWKLIPSGDGFSTQIVNVAGATRCLDTVNGANPSLVFPGVCNGSTKQRWVIETSVGGKRIKNLAFGTVMEPNLSVVSNNVFTNAPQFSTPGKLRQSWKVG